MWEFAGVYADEALTGTKVKGREEFQSMIEACEDGDIDLILTKSITRFARNTVECIQTIRRLKEIGVGIYFEKDYIWKRSYPVYGRFSFDKTQYLVVFCCFVLLHFVACRLFVA